MPTERNAAADAWVDDVLGPGADARGEAAGAAAAPTGAATPRTPTDTSPTAPWDHSADETPAGAWYPTAFDATPDGTDGGPGASGGDYRYGGTQPADDPFDDA